MKRISRLLFIFCVVLLTGCASTQPTEARRVDIRPLACFWYDGTAEASIAKRFAREVAFAQHVAVYSVAAYNVYDDDSKRYEDIPFPNDETWQVIESKNAIQDGIGFAAQAWTRTVPDGGVELIVAYRGTDSFLKDFFKGNLVFAKHLFGRTQFDAALDYYREIKTRTSSLAPTRTVLVGHSLGGGLAEYVQRLVPGTEAITFDPSPNQGRLYSLFDAKQPRDAVRVYERGEVLSYLRYVMSPDLRLEASPVGTGVLAIWFDFYANNPISAHSMRDLSASLIKVAAAAGHPASKNILLQLQKRPETEAATAPDCRNAAR